MILLLLITQAVAALAASPTTNPTPTNTYCPRFYSTSAVPRPTNYVCGGTGTLSNANLLQAYCYTDQVALGGLNASTTEYDICYRACVQDSRCISYSVDPANYVCYTYGKALSDMGYKSDPNIYHDFYNLKGCFNCTTATAPPAKSCPSSAKAKTPAPQGYTCGAAGRLQNYDAVYNFTFAGQLRNECYRVCAEYYDPVGVCESFAEIRPTCQNCDPYCLIFSKSLVDKGFKPDSTSTLRAWNLRGCFECEEPTKTATGCTPSYTPRRIGILNGNFQDTYVDNNSPQPNLLPSGWFAWEDAEAVPGAKGNIYVALGGSKQGGNIIDFGFLATSAYGLNRVATGPKPVYNVSFDLAIPDYADNEPGRPGCALEIGIPNYTLDMVIPANSSTYRGTTFKTVGPYQVAFRYLEPSRYESFSFHAVCQGDDNRVTNATFWIDNVRITKNGRDVGQP